MKMEGEGACLNLSLPSPSSRFCPVPISRVFARSIRVGSSFPIALALANLAGSSIPLVGRGDSSRIAGIRSRYERSEINSLRSGICPYEFLSLRSVLLRSATNPARRALSNSKRSDEQRAAKSHTEGLNLSVRFFLTLA